MNRSARYVKAANALFEAWEEKEIHAGRSFIRDGIINPTQWFSQDIRPLFLLKEAYDKEGTGGWDLAKEHNCDQGECDQPQKRTTWPNLSRWSYGIFETTKDKTAPYMELPDFHKKRNRYLQRIAVVNVKKSGGKTQSKMSDLKHYARDDRDELLAQIELIDPTIIICGYTFSLLEIIIDPQRKIKRNDEWIYCLTIAGKTIPVIDFYHPSYRRSKIALFEKLMEVYQKTIS